MKKIIVIGCPGSGKSTFSKALHEVTGIPLFRLDMLFWNEDKTTVGRTVFLDYPLYVCIHRVYQELQFSKQTASYGIAGEICMQEDLHI